MLGSMTYVCGPSVEKMSFDIDHGPRNRPLHRDMQPNIVMKEMLLPFHEIYQYVASFSTELNIYLYFETRDVYPF